MEKKWSPKNIALLVLVLSVWTYMGLRAFDYFEDEEIVESSESSEDVLELGEDKPKKMAYGLIPDSYRDPFLGKISKTRVSSGRQSHGSHQQQNNHSNSQIKRGSLTNLPNEPLVVPWPSIKFGGTIENPKNKESVAVLIINGREDFYSIGQSSQDVKVLSFSSDQITVEFNGETKVIGK